MACTRSRGLTHLYCFLDKMAEHLVLDELLQVLRPPSLDICLRHTRRFDQQHVSSFAVQIQLHTYRHVKDALLVAGVEHSTST